MNDKPRCWRHVLPELHKPMKDPQAELEQAESAGWEIKGIEEGPSLGMRVTFVNRQSGRELTGIFTRWVAHAAGLTPG